MSRVSPLAAIVLAIATLGCVRALRDPVPLPTPDTVPETVASVDPDSLFATRDLDAVRDAATVWRSRLAHDSTSFDALLGLMQAEIWLAGHEPVEDDRRAAARRAVESGQWCGTVAGPSPECDYWLAAAIGVQARERRSTAVDAMPRIEALFLAARDAIPDYDHAGPDRALALVYLRAPGFPVGPGDPDTGLEHAREAVRRFPDWPPNQLALGEALVALDETSEGIEAYRRARELAAAEPGASDPDAPEWAAEADEALAAGSNPE